MKNQNRKLAHSMLGRFGHKASHGGTAISALLVYAGCGGVAEPEDESVAAAPAALVASEVEPLALPVNWTSSAWGGSLDSVFADVSGDGRADAVARGTTSITVRRSTGTGLSSTVQTWSSSAFNGTVGTYFADVTGGGTVDVIAVNSGNIQVRPSNGSAFGSSQTWLSTGFSGTVNTFFADVNGDGRADAIAMNTTGIVVRLSTGSAFGSSQTWTTFPFHGDVANYFADVTGDGRADAVGIRTENVWVCPARADMVACSAAELWSTTPFVGGVATAVGDMTGDGLADLVAVNGTQVTMRRSNRWFFGEAEVLQNGSYSSALTWRLADVTGGSDKRADLVSRSASVAVAVRASQLRTIPLRFVQFVANSANAISVSQLQNAITTANKVFSDAGIRFTLPGANNNVVVSSALSDLTPLSPATETQLAAAKNSFNPGCSLGYSDYADLPRWQQLEWVAARCSLSGEILIYVANSAGNGSFGTHPGAGKLVMMSPINITDQNTVNGLLAHELGHYLALPHAFDLGFDPTGHVDPATGQGLVMSKLWDLMYAPGPIAFNSAAEAATNEANLRSIMLGGTGWYCPSGDAAKPCPSTAFPPLTQGFGTIGMPVGDTGQVWFSGDVRLKGLALRLPADGMNAVNIMSYNYHPQTNGFHLRTPGLSLSQVQQVRSNLSGDVVVPYLSASGQVLYGDRRRLGITGAAETLEFVSTNGFAKAGPGTIASNGAETWVVGTNGFDADGNGVHRWDIPTRQWISYSMGAAQIAVPSDGAREWPNITPWAITNSGTVKRFDGTTFVEPPNSSGSCAVSLAVGPRLEPNPRKYAWAVGCLPVNQDGNRQIYRYRQVDGVDGWVPTTGYAAQVAVDGRGIPWARTVQGIVYRANLDSNDMPTTWAAYPAPSGTVSYLTAGAHRNTYLPPTMLGSNGHLYTWKSTGWQDAFVPSITFTQIASALPYTWAVDGTGRIWYAR